MNSIRLEQRGSAAGGDVVMIHGCPSTPQSMWRIGEALTDVARVTNVTLPGYDGAAVLASHDETALLEAIEQALLAAAVREPVLVGFSFGAFRSFELAVRRNLRVRAIASLGGLHEMSAPMREGLRASAAVIRDPTNDLPSLFTSHFLSPAGMKDPSLVAEIARWCHVAPRDVLGAELDAISVLPDVVLSRLEIPVLARVGSLDVAVPVALTDSICAAVPQARREVVPGVAHALMLEDEEGTAMSVRAFVLDVG